MRDHGYTSSGGKEASMPSIPRLFRLHNSLIGINPFAVVPSAALQSESSGPGCCFEARSMSADTTVAPQSDPLLEVCQRFEAACKAAEPRPRIETFLEEVPASQRPALLRALVLVEITSRSQERPLWLTA